MLWKPQSTRKTLAYMANPDEYEKPYLTAKPAPTRKTLTNMKTLDYEQNPNLKLMKNPTPKRNPHIHEKP